MGCTPAALRPRLRLLPTLALAGCAWAGLAPGLQAQFVERARLDWQTLETPHFRYIFPRQLAPWAEPVAARFESVRGAVDALVGFSPRARVTVVMDDPVTMSNGLSVPELAYPTMLFLATPPGPRTEIGDNPGWGEILSVHEYAHAAHMTRPSRNPLQRRIETLPLLPLDWGPIARRAPRWLLEGYATFVEGRLTGSGRPHGVWRAAVLRQWALEGKLPSYGGMNGTGGYRGGSMAYLAGSAFLEWLVGQRGDSALPHVWRRLTARQRRSFPAAFAGVFGGRPEDLYDRFRVDVTARAVAARATLDSAGLAEGDTVQSLAWQTGDPALSADGSRMAIVLRGRDQPGRVVVWSTAAEPPDTAAARRQARALARDPEDVPAVRPGPRPKRALATLWPAPGGRAYERPRFLPDGEHILLTRFEALPDGSSRPDLVIWDWKRGGVRRVTHGASIVWADPLPDGRAAIAVRCLWGSCDLVHADLRTGAVRLLAAGAPDVVYARPRVSRDGRHIAVSVQRAGRWGVVLLDADGGAARRLDPGDGAQRYDPAFLPDGRLVVTSEAGGIPNLEVLDPAAGGARPITRVTGAAMAGEPALDGSVYFLRLHARGLDLARVRADAHIGPTVALDPRLTPASPLAPAPGLSFPARTLPPARGYGLGPRQVRLIPSFGIAEGMIAGRLALAGSDPVGRLGWLAQGAFGRTIWRGGSLRLNYRGVLPEPRLDVFGTSHRPGTVDATGAETGLPARVRWNGGAGALALRGLTSAGSYHAILGGATGPIAFDSVHTRRILGWIDLARSVSWALGPASAGGRLGVIGAAGSTARVSWSRALVQARLAARAAGGPKVELRATRGVESGGGAFEGFSVGGEEPPLFDPALLSQQVAMPALPEGSLVGRRITLLEGRLALAGATAYAWGGRASGSAGWQRVLGLEQEMDTDPVPLLRIPGIHALLGVGYTLDEKPHRSLRLYGTVALRP